MIVQARYLFILYYLNLVAAVGRPKLHYASTSRMPFINLATSGFITDYILKKAAIDEVNYDLNLKNFMLNIMIPELILPDESSRQNTLKLMYVAYIATEYYYSLSLCTIWDYTTKNGINNDIFFLLNLKRDGILDLCWNAALSFHSFIVYYTLAIKEIGITQFSNKDLVFNIKLEVSKCVEDISNISIISTINGLGLSMFEESSVRHYLYNWLGNEARCLIKIRKYFDFFAFGFSKVDFRGPVTMNSLRSSTSTNNIIPIISQDEQFTWRNIIHAVNFYQSRSHIRTCHPLKVLTKCELLRDELMFYMTGEIPQIYPLETERYYEYPRIEMVFDPRVETFALILKY